MEHHYFCFAIRYITSDSRARDNHVERVINRHIVSSGVYSDTNRSLPLSLCAENEKYLPYFRNEATIDEIRHREQIPVQIKHQNRFS